MKRIDMRTWSRREPYRYFSGMQWPYCSLTCEVTVTPARAFMKGRGIGSYLGMICLVAKAANQVPELRLRIEDGDVCEHEVVHPSFTVQNDSGRLAFCQARYSEDPNEFLPLTRADMDRTKRLPEPPLQSAGNDRLYLSCLPWVHFTSVSHPMNMTPQDSIPRITWGRFQPKGDETVLAVDLLVHHGLADGAHMAQFMLKLEEFCAEPEKGFAGLRP